MVASGITLTVEPSVRVEFDPGKSLIVRGTLVARGTDSSGIVFTGNQTQTLRIIAGFPLPDGIVAEPYSASLVAIGGTPPYTWSIVSGALPPGLSLGEQTGTISGSPTTAGASSFTVRSVTEAVRSQAAREPSLLSPSATGTFSLSGRVSDQSGTPITGAMVAAIDPVSDTTVVSTTTDSNGSYLLYVAGGVYDITVKPRAESGFTPAIALDRSITTDSVLDFVLVPIGTVSLSGQVLDAKSHGIQSVQVTLYAATGNAVGSVSTDGMGLFAFQVATGTYSLAVDSPPSPSANWPQHFDLRTTSFSLTQSVVLDIRLPASQVTVHVQDASGTPVANVDVSTSSAPGTMTCGWGTSRPAGSPTTRRRASDRPNPETPSCGCSPPNRVRATP